MCTEKQNRDLYLKQKLKQEDDNKNEEKENYDLINSFYYNIDNQEKIAVKGCTEISREIRTFSKNTTHITHKLVMEETSNIKGVKKYGGIIEKENTILNIFEYDFLPSKQKDKIQEEIIRKCNKIIINYRPFILSSINIDTIPGVRTKIRFEQNNFFEKEFVTFCEIEKLQFTQKQLFIMIYFFKNFPINQKDYNSKILRTKKQKGYDKYVLFYRKIVIPTFNKNKEKYKTIENCFVNIANNFNKIKKLSMTHPEIMEFFNTFEYRTDVPLELALNISFDTSFFDDRWNDSLLNIGLERFNDKRYNNYLNILNSELDKISIKN